MTEYGGAMRSVASILLVMACGRADPLPPDGGHMLRSVIRALTGSSDERAPRIVSVVFAAAIAALAVVKGFHWGAFLAGYFAVMNVAALQGRTPGRM